MPKLTFTLTIRSADHRDDQEAYRSLKALLKRMRRGFGWRCTRIEPATANNPESNVVRARTTEAGNFGQGESSQEGPVA